MIVTPCKCYTPIINSDILKPDRMRNILMTEFANFIAILFHSFHHGLFTFIIVYSNIIYTLFQCKIVPIVSNIIKYIYYFCMLLSQ